MMKAVIDEVQAPYLMRTEDYELLKRHSGEELEVFNMTDIWICLKVEDTIVAVYKANEVRGRLICGTTTYPLWSSVTVRRSDGHWIKADIIYCYDGAFCRRHKMFAFKYYKIGGDVYEVDS